MKKTFLCYLLLAISLQNFAQNKWEFGFIFEPGISGIAFPIIDVGSSKDQYHFKVNYCNSAGSIVNFKLNDKLNLSTGISYCAKSYGFYQNRVDMDTALLNFNSQTDTTFLHILKWTMNSTYRFLNVPIKFKYRLANLTKIDMYINSGISFNYLFGGKTIKIMEYDYGSYTIDPYMDLYSESSNKLFLSLELGFGLEYPITDRIKMLIEPSCKYFLQKTENSYPINGNLYNFSFKIGFLYLL